MISSVSFPAETAHQIHFVFEWLAVFCGVQTYRWLKRRKNQPKITDGESCYVVLCWIFGAGLGNKLVFALEMPFLWQTQGWQTLAQGQSIVGGLIGGLIGVEITKKLRGIRYSTGDDFILPLIIGTIVGRIGCFLAGLNDGTYGLPTNVAWGINFGDGIARHPTQLYDMVIVSSLGFLLWQQRLFLTRVSGLSFKLYLSSYLLWRFGADGFLKPIPYAYWLGFSGIQWVCFIALLVYFPLVIRDFSKTFSSIKSSL